MKELALNESKTCLIYAENEWNHTGVILVKGCLYSFETEKGASWKDWFISTGPDGFTKWYLAWVAGMKRVPNQRWFALIGTYNKESPFLIGSGMKQLEAQRTGELVCFANDLKGFYWNNKGALTLKISRSK